MASFLSRSRTTSVILSLSVLGALAGCSALDLGPEPSNRVGASSRRPVPLPDPALAAVPPAAHGVVEDYLPGNGQTPATMPAATEPTTTQPATGPASTDPAISPGLGRGVGGLTPASGHVRVPAQLPVQDATLIGLQNNVSRRVQKYTVPTARQGEEIARAQFDPSVSGS